MPSTTFIHTSDLQIGMTLWFLAGEAQARFSAARVAAIDKLGELARETGAEFIVVAGDVFEHNALNRQTTGRAREALERLPVPVYLLPGNHDPLVADSVFFHALDGNSRGGATEESGVRVLDSTEPVQVADGVEVVGAPYMSKRVNRDLVAEAIEPLEPTDDIRIVVGHGQVESRSSDPAPDLIDLAGVERAIADRRVDYLALGDTHSTTDLSSTGAVWFSGAPETTDYHELPAGGGENDSGNALVVTVNKAAGASTPATVEVEKHAIGEWTFDAIDMDVNTAADVEKFVETLRAYPDKDRTAVKYSLRGTVSLTEQAELERALEELEPIFASLRPRERLHDLHLAPNSDELADLDVAGYAADALTELVADLETDPTARDAANLLFRLSSQGGK